MQRGSGDSAYWHIRLFGPLHLMSGKDVAVRFAGRKAGALLARLALPPGRPLSREFLAEALWPNSNGSAARTNLRFVLNSLRKNLETVEGQSGDVLVTSNSTIELRAEAITTDVSQFEKEMAAAQDSSVSDPRARIVHLTNAIRLYQGDLLVDYYEDWVLQERERLRELYRSALNTAALLLEAEGDTQTAMDFARSSISCDPLREESHIHLIRLYIAVGDHQAALRQYRDMERFFLKEMKSSPSTAARAYLPVIRSLKGKQLTEVNEPPSPSASLAEPKLTSFGLPRPLTTFFRRKECEEILEAVRDNNVRLLTLTGPSGAGKTRASIEVGNELTRVFGDSILFMPTAEYDRIELLADAICDALRLHRSTILDEFQEKNEQLMDSLKRDPVLLILDGFEHLAPSGSTVIRNLIQRVPGLTCLVTSRSQLRLTGEFVIEMPPLRVPRNTDSNDQICATESYRMLVDRIRMVRPQFMPSPVDNAEIAEICRRLEGLPLAIELAAPWMQVLSPREILQQLDDPFTFLVSDNADVPESHRSLLGAIQRSYDLLPPYLQPFFCSLSVFESGFTLEAVQTVLEEPQAAIFLRQLKESSLIHSVERGLQTLFFVQDSVRAFAWNLLSADARETLASQHAEYYLHLGFEAESHIGESEREEWFAELDSRMPNFRRALDWCLLVSPAQYVFLTSALWLFWYLNGQIHEGQTRLKQAMQLADTLPDLDIAAAKVRLGLACLAYTQGDPGLGLPLLKRSLEQFHRMRYSGGTATYLSGLAKFAAFRGDYALSRSLLEESLSLWQDVHPEAAPNSLKEGSGVGKFSGTEIRWEIAENARRLGDIVYCEGNLLQAEKKYQESLFLFQELYDHEGIAATYTGLAVVDRARANYAAARDHIYQALRIRTRQGNMRGIATAQRILACIESREGNFPEAHGWIKECLRTLATQTNIHGMTGILTVAGTVSLCEQDYDSAVQNIRSAIEMAEQQGDNRRIAYSQCFLTLAYLSEKPTFDGALIKKSLYWFYEVGDRCGLALALEVVACIAAARGDDLQAASQLNTAAALRQAIGSPVPPAYQALYDGFIKSARHRLGDYSFRSVPVVGGGTDMQAILISALRQQ